ncbi:MAG TPA: DUF1579 domain-containing protein [Phycisphaerae bacterium]|nr:DUF1579 domain-containing protein [Phycisphaerae bacterium]HNU45721.1 DUF1579 domain-containing protein [Phycisphaerae bacterium]
MFKKVAMYLVAALVGAGLFAAASAMSEEPQQPPMSMEEMMKKYAELSKPGPEHAQFQNCVGKWKTETKMWMGPEPTVSAGTSEMELMFGGRFVKEQFHCLSAEMPFDGVSITGYDKAKKKYVSIWFDSLSTGFMVSEGTYDATTKTMTMFGESVDPLMGPVKSKSVIREVSKDKTVMEMFMLLPGGQEQKSMEITYTRGGA